MKVTLKNITKKFGSTLAVDNFSAALPDGHLICLLGPSGCGKSTILNILCGIVDATEGQIFFDDQDVTSLPPDLRGIGMVFQNYALYPHLTVLENISFPLEVQKIPKKERIQKATEIAKLVHVDSLLKRYPGELSGGQQQRVAIARALVKQPKLLLMDEPLSNLDARLRLEMREEIRRIQLETGVTTVFVTHDQEEAMAISDSIILMKDGVFVQEGLCQELYNNPNCKFVADFLGNPPINNIECRIKDNIALINEQKINIKNINCNNCENAILAIRPESIIIYKNKKYLPNVELYDFNLNATLNHISQMGKEQIAYIDFYGIQLRAIISGDEPINSKEQVNICFKKKGFFIFNKETGERLV